MSLGLIELYHIGWLGAIGYELQAILNLCAINGCGVGASCMNTLRQRQIDCHFAYSILRYVSMKEKFRIWFEILLSLPPEVQLTVNQHWTSDDKRIWSGNLLVKLCWSLRLSQLAWGSTHHLLGWAKQPISPPPLEITVSISYIPKCDFIVIRPINRNEIWKLQRPCTNVWFEN